jgi:hypothetical protein
LLDITYLTPFYEKRLFITVVVVTHACRKRRLKWVTTLPLRDINTEAWSSGMEVGRGANNPTLQKRKLFKSFQEIQSDFVEEAKA